MNKLGLVLLLIVFGIILIPGIFSWLFGLIGFSFKAGLVLLLVISVLSLISGTKRSITSE